MQAARTKLGFHILRIRVEAEPNVLGISNSEERGAVKRLLFFVLLPAIAGLTSCGYKAPSTGVTCTTITSTTSATTSTSTCTDPATNISVTISPATVSVNVVTTQQFLDFVQGGTNSVTIWQVNSITGGNDTVGRIDSNGLYHAPATVPSPATVTVGAVSFEDQKVAATSAVTVIPSPIVTITSPAAPVTVTSGTANTVTFSATETGGATNTILWYVGPVGGLGVLGGNATLGTISASGVYSPPLTPPIGQTVTVTAAAQDSPTSTATLSVTISGYSTSSLQGQFAFSMAGSNASGHFFRAGSFVADGAGKLNTVLEDTNNSSSATTTPISTTGTYTVSADGRGTLQFNDGLTPASFNYVLVNGAQLQIIGFDATGTAAGQANAQDASTFAGTPLTAFNGIYVFDFAGVHGSNELSQIGEFDADGAGHIKSGSIDINDGGALSQFPIFGNQTVCTSPPSSLSTYSIGSNGRGTLTLTTCAAGPTLTLNFYVVSRGSAKFVGTDTVKQVAGFTSQQVLNATLDVTALKGNYAFVLAGSAPGGPIATAGSFSANGTGCLKANTGVLDENVNGTATPDLSFSALPLSDPACPMDAGKYTVASSGRGTMNFQTSNRTYSLVFYLGAAGSAVVQETDAGHSSDGNFTLQQSALFTLASIQGNYAIETSGLSGSSLQVSTGQIATDGKGAVTSGKIDTNTGGTLVAGQTVTGSYSAPGTSGRATLTLNSGAPNYAAYVVSPTQVYILGIQSGQLAVGALLRQF
jgi:hypothetical protein